MPITGVIPEPAVTKRSLPPSGGQHELAGRLLEVHQGAGPGPAHEMVADRPVGDGLDGDRDPAVGAGAVGQRVGAPEADAVDVDAHTDVLARDVPRPVRAGADHQGRGVGGLGVDLLDPPAQVGAAAERVEDVEVVRGDKGGRGELGDAADVLPESAQRPGAAVATGREKGRCGHESMVLWKRSKIMTVGREYRPRFCS